MAEQLKDFLASTTLNGTITSGATSLVVTSAANFPTEGMFDIRIDDELLTVTAVSGTTFTVTRAAGTPATTAAAHSSGVAVKQVLTKRALDAAISEGGGGGGWTLEALFRRATDFTSGDSLWTDLVWTLEDYDPHGYSAPNASMTIPAGRGGTFLVEFGCESATITSGSFNVRLNDVTSGDNVLRSIGMVGTAPTRLLSANWCGALDAADVLKVQVMQTEGGGRTWPLANGMSFCKIWRAA
jgi:hypothetical protein